jgi:hypothetical protein
VKDKTRYIDAVLNKLNIPSLYTCSTSS